MKNTARGFALVSGPGGSVERETFTCKHCGGLQVVPRAATESMGGFCQMCFGLTCTACAAKGSCTPFEKTLEERLRRDERMRAIGAALR